MLPPADRRERAGAAQLPPQSLGVGREGGASGKGATEAKTPGAPARKIRYIEVSSQRIRERGAEKQQDFHKSPSS